MNYRRNLQDQLQEAFFKGKILMLVGPRQVGKTTLSEEVLTHFAKQGKRIKRVNCDNFADQEAMSTQNLSHLKTIVGDADILFIDEGQKVLTIGQTLKLLIDHYKDSKQILVTGSSSFNLLDQTEEALTGRKWVFHLYPLSVKEILGEHDMLTESKLLEGQLIYGMYPEVVTRTGIVEKQRTLDELATSQLYKDILEFQEVKNSAVLRNLLKALALQIGSEVSYTELSTLLGIDKNTVERYVDLLEKSYVIFRLAPYYSNKRTEIKKQKKIYFYDVGIRNAIIQNYNPLDSRNDVGALFENFLMVERFKKRSYDTIRKQPYFWRTYSQQEIDLIEEGGGQLHAYEFKWNAKKRVKAPRIFTETYPEADFLGVTRDNFLDFIF